MGLDVYLYHGTGDNAQEIEQPSSKYPDHLFKVGYFRSSYNSGGINHVSSQYNLPGLYEIFEVEDHEYEISPDWKQCLTRCNDAIAAWKNADTEFSVTECTFYHGNVAASDNEALEIFKSKYTRPQSDNDFNDFSCREGYFYLKGLEIYGVIPGKNIIGGPCVYLIDKSGDRNEWYTTALEIVKETIEFVLAQPDPESYVLHWSG